MEDSTLWAKQNTYIQKKNTQCTAFGFKNYSNISVLLRCLDAKGYGLKYLI